MGIFARIAAGAGWDSGRRTRDALAKADANFQLLEPSVKASAAANYVPVQGDKVISRTNAGAQTVTVPANATTAFPVGTQILVEQSSAGALTIAAAGGVTLNKLASKTLVAAGQFAMVRLTKIAANVWNVSGDLTAA